MILGWMQEKKEGKRLGFEEEIEELEIDGMKEERKKGSQKRYGMEVRDERRN